MSSHTNFFARVKAPKHSEEDWEAQKLNIERFEKQLKSRLPKWGLDIKNLKRETMVQIAQKKAKRKVFEGKESSFRVHKRLVRDQNIDRFLQRHAISEKDLLEMNSPINAPSPAFSIFTPKSIVSPTPELDHTSPPIDSSTSSNELNILPMYTGHVAKITKYQSATIEDVVDEDLESSASLIRAQTGGEDLPTTDKQHSSSFAAISSKAVEVRTSRPYAYIPPPPLKYPSTTPENSERRFIWVTSPSAKQSTTLSPELGARIPHSQAMPSSPCVNPSSLQFGGATEVDDYDARVWNRKAIFFNLLASARARR
ncbi:uncharacterized protein LY89DRAFT_742101 [Mollisia scopiformis]|uniref:Clr5 domain-containing protein n=1 Tax=Mollisia scopiformis TaxID=149040 RepID=A0A132B783_MOLSC|nr:uncharacterized protein LY89DRAFT_742101 [Mollisia scopiformis]KUJ08266.1 hypothetical protein LY89DRAFT_742101 [Mollisia scopiformis]